MKYPNVEALDRTFQEYIARIHDPAQRFIPDDEVYVFPQVWPNAGGGFAQPGYMYGQATTKQYTVVIINKNENAAMVAFDDQPAYYVNPITRPFMRDLSDRRMAGCKGSHIYNEEAT